MTTSMAIATQGLTKNFAKNRAVDDLSLQVPRRCVYGFLGPNGAGKTTTMRLLLGLLRASAGSVFLNGHDIARDRIAALRGTGAVIETPALYDHLTGHANLALTARLLKLDAVEIDRVLDIVDMAKAADRKVGGYSLGMKQRLALARALLGNPRLLLLDEPSNGLDPEGMAVMRTLIRDLPERLDCTIFLSSHILSEVEQVASVIGVMKQGRLLVQGSARELLGGSDTVQIGLSDAEAGSELLVRAGYAVVARGKGRVDISVGSQDSAREAAARVNALLVGAGVSVHRVQENKRSLEQLYHQLSDGEISK